MTSKLVPEGFVQLPQGLGFTDSIQPSYRRVQGDRVSFGMLVQAQHSNSMGICHGGALMTLADVTAASGVNMARGVRSGSPTVNLAMDFIASAHQGDWVQADAEQVSVKRRFGFCSGAIYNRAGIVARFNGTFYLPDHKGMWRDGAPTDGVLQGLEKGE